MSMTDEKVLEALRATAAEPVRSLKEAGQVFCAWCLLALIDLALSVGGFERLWGLVKRWPTIGAAPANMRWVLAEEICAAVNRARTYYFRRAWCLQGAGAAVCLLRWRGVSAQLVIGVRKFPFYAHAWAEVDGTVVNDLPSRKTTYSAIARC